jgi:hypothetical protein
MKQQKNFITHIKNEAMLYKKIKILLKGKLKNKTVYFEKKNECV